GHWRARCRHSFRFADELAVISVRNPRPLRQTPQVPARWLGYIVIRHSAAICALVIVAPASSVVVRRYGLFRVVRDVRRHRPVVTVRAHFGIYEEAVEYPEALSERVMVRRHAVREKEERCVTVSLPQITEYLIVGAVFLDYIDDVLERRILLFGLRGIPSIGRRHAFGKSVQLSSARPDSRNDSKGAVDLPERVVRRVRGHRLAGLPMSGIGCSAAALAIDHKEIAAFCRNS